MAVSRVVEINLKKKKLICGFSGFCCVGFVWVFLSSIRLYEIAEKTHHLFFVCVNMGICMCMHLCTCVEERWEELHHQGSFFLFQSP